MTGDEGPCGPLGLVRVEEGLDTLRALVFERTGSPVDEDLFERFAAQARRQAATGKPIDWSKVLGP